MDHQRSRFAAHVVAAVAALALVASACGSDGSSAPAATVELASSDGRIPGPTDVVSAVATSGRAGNATVLTSPTTLGATVTVPDAAMGDIDPTDLTAEVHSSADEGSSAIAFDLGPDGSEFDRPVSLEWDGPWSPTASFSLMAMQGDGTPVDTSERDDVNSVGALRIEPTSETTAHYTLPITHFSVWVVTVSGEVDVFDLEASFALALTATVDSPAIVPVTTRSMSDAGVNVIGCHRGAVVSTTGGVTASFPSVDCADIERALANGERQRPLTLSVTCTRAGAGTVTSSLDATISLVALQASASDPATDREAIEEILDLVQRLLSMTDIYDDSWDIDAPLGLTLRASFTLEVTCEEPDVTTSEAPDDTPDPASSSTSTTAPAPQAPTTTSRPTTASTTTTGGATTTSVGGGTSSATSTSLGGADTTSSSPSIPSSGATSSTAPATMPSTAATSTTATTAAPPSTPAWGPEGAWAYNEYGTCDWNGSGACGWYYSNTPGTYILGPART